MIKMSKWDVFLVLIVAVFACFAIYAVHGDVEQVPTEIDMTDAVIFYDSPITLILFDDEHDGDISLSEDYKRRDIKLLSDERAKLMEFPNKSVMEYSMRNDDNAFKNRSYKEFN